MPERRIAKFLKKDRKSTGLSATDDLVLSKDDDDGDASVSSTSRFVKKAGSSLKNIFSGKEDAIQSTNEKKGFFRSPLKSLRNKKQEKKKLAVQAKVVSALVVVPIVAGDTDVKPFQKEKPPTLLLPAEPDVPHENISPPDENTSPPDENISPPDENISPPDENILPPDENISPPDENISLPDENISPPDENISLPDENISPPGAVSKGAVYHDDNDGRYEATLCDGCVIL